MMERPNNWRVLLINHILEAERKPFKYGENDCAIFAADAVKVMTGEDYAAEFRGTYSTAIGAKRKLKAAGFNDLAHLASNKFEEVPPLTATIGDLAIVEGDSGPALGVVLGADIATASGRVPLIEIKKAYRV